MDDFSVKDYLLNKIDEDYRSFGFKGKTVEEHKRWKADVRDRLKKISGIDRMRACSLNYNAYESEKIGKITRTKAIISTQDKIKMPFYILRPDNGNGKVVLAIHGHGSDGKNVLSGIINESIKEKAEKYNYSYAMELAEMGFTVYVPDLCGSGERREKKQSGDENLTKSSCNDINFALISVGLSLQGIIAFDLMRLIDFITDENNTDKICCVGFSGGGLSALWLSALDERVDLTVVSGYFHGFRDTALESNYCGCNFVPELWKTVDCGDFAAAIAPRKLIIEAGKDDKLNGTTGMENVYPQLEIAGSAYKLYNLEGNLSFFECSGGHKWYGSGMDLIKMWGEGSD